MDDLKALVKAQIKVPGLTPGFPEIRRLAEALPKEAAVLSYKEILACLWVLFIGGTGTGKSTLFNALCCVAISETGMERPKTSGPIAFADQAAPIEEGFPFSSMAIKRLPSSDSTALPTGGTPASLTVVGHQRPGWSHLVIGDTPDLDSLESTHRAVTKDLSLLADAIIFVTSQEKYADEAPYSLLRETIQSEKPYFLLLNKAREGLRKEEVLEIFQGHDLSLLKERIWILPYAPSRPSEWMRGHSQFQDFVIHFSRELSVDHLGDLLERQRLLKRRTLHEKTIRLLELLVEEEQASEDWVSRLEGLCERVEQDLLSEEKARFGHRSRKVLGKEIRKLFKRYDLLARPREVVKGILWSPFRLLGFGRQGAQEEPRKALEKISERIDLASIQTAVQRFSRLVLEKLSPREESSALFGALRSPGVLLGETEIQELVWEEHYDLLRWLEKTFERLSEGISRGKKWGIYSTTILWGILILSFEAIVGGGFSVLDAVLGSALAPVLTRGAVEIFAYHEIQNVGRELAGRYQRVLTCALYRQLDRYKHCLQSVSTPRETMKLLEALRSGLTDEAHDRARDGNG